MHKGRCLCGKVEYEIDQKLDLVVNCHCHFCRKAHGSQFTTVLGMKGANMKIVKGAHCLEDFKVGPGGRVFCSTCGTRIYNRSPVAGMISLITATLDEEDQAIPIAHVNVESKHPLTQFNDDLPTYQGHLTESDLMQLLPNN
jgi:hypothetical protein